MATPTPDGGIRTLVEGIDYAPDVYQSAGFDLHLGPLGDILEIRIHTEAVESGESRSRLVVALFFDEDENGTFFEWESTGETERWVGYGGDEMGLVTAYNYVGETVRIDEETTLGMVNRRSAWSTLRRLNEGVMEWPDTLGENRSRKSGESRGIHADTDSAVYVGLADNGDGERVEAIVEDVVVLRR